MGSEGTLTLSWLIRLRWAALAVYALLIAWGALGLVFGLPLGLLACLLLAHATSNLALTAWWGSEGPGPRGLTGAVLAFDVLLLGGLLYATGGPANPCSALFLMPVALAASALGSRWGWAMALLADGTYALLFPWHLPLGHLDHAMGGMAWHLGGMWAGMALTSGLVAHFVGRLSEALARQREVAEELRHRADREARLAAVTALAAGAAHELATPLASIAVAAEDLDPSDAAGLAEDVALIRAEVERCRAILDGLAHEGGQLQGEAPHPVALGAWLARERIFFGPQVRVEVTEARLCVPPRAFAMVMRALVKNAKEAAGPGATVGIEGGPQVPGAYRLTVEDPGPGFPEGVESRLGEPFLSTKGEEGLGLGLFLAQGFAERMGGRLEVDSQPGRTRVSLVLPMEAGT